MIQIKGLRAIATDIAVDSEDNLIFARRIPRSPDEVRGVRHAVHIFSANKPCYQDRLCV